MFVRAMSFRAMSFRARAGAAAAVLLAAGLLIVPAAQAATYQNGQLTGRQLASVLLPASYFWSGYKVEKSSAYSSGSRLEHSAARYNLAAFSCATYLLHGLPDTGFGETAAAGDALGDRVTSYQQAVYQFSSSGRAAWFYQRLYAFTSRCRSVTATAGKATASLTTQSLRKTRADRYPAFRAVQTVYLTGLPATGNDTLVTLAGTDVFLMDAAGQAPAAKSALTTALLRLIARVQAFR
jgi:hypothetical protein